LDADQSLELGRMAYVQRSWTQAYEGLSTADRTRPLAPDDLELLAISAHMLGREDEWASLEERAHHDHLEAGATRRALRCAFWLGLNLMLRGELARASGWLARAQRLLDREPDPIERGYLMVPAAVERELAGDYEGAHTTAGEAAQIGERLGDADLFSLAVHEQGAMLIKLGEVERGLALLDEAMLAVTAGELSPMITGMVYCSVIQGCQEVYALRRAQEWTDALTRWCAEQPDMVAFTGRCRVHRAEIMQLHGDWGAALAEARSAVERGRRAMSQPAVAEAHYRQGELHRLRGETAAAERAYLQASEHGVEPQPGLALLRLALGNARAAAAALRRALAETTDPLRRARLLPAYVETALGARDLEAAREACDELERIGGVYRTPTLEAIVSDARGAVELAGGDARAALVALRRASQAWQGHRAPYEGARTRIRIGLACRALGDEESAMLELNAAREVFGRLGAEPDLARLEAAAVSADPHGLTPRELEVLRMVAAGATNKAIATALVLSTRTVDRHVSNILAKLGVPSRAAATAYAYEHELV
jgi:DNA-binding CsgD family transcriptional regulator